MNMEKMLKFEKDLRLQEEKEFRNQIRVIIKEFE